MKKHYIKPQMIIEIFKCENVLQVISLPTGTSNGLENLGEEDMNTRIRIMKEDGTWGDLWEF